jgi:hypothetical protein
MAPRSRENVRAVDLIVIGGGCYGCYHTRQLLKAQRRGTIAARRFLVVDRNPSCRALAEFAGEPLVEVVRADWAAFLCGHLATATPESDDQLVPAPFAPHLLFDWLLAALRADVPGVALERTPCELALGLPYEQGDAAGNRFISAAGWLCPATCIEPARCPAIHAPRTWELGEIVRAAATRASDPYAAAELFTCRHFAFGIGTIPVASLARARQRLADLLAGGGTPQPRRLLIGTVSACHGVLGEVAARPVPVASRR